ncbi:MAG: hypothetical protein ACN2B6_12340 [Rickettsiales bacterium]
MFLRQSTSQVVRFGPFLDSTDGVTAETGLTIAQADMQLSKDGGAYAQKNTTGNATHDADGWYSTTLDATDTNTCGELYMQVNVSGSIPVWVRWWVLEEAVYDSLYGAGAAGFDSNQRVNVGQWLSNAVTVSAGNLPDVNIAEISDDATAADNLELDYDGTGYAKINSTIGTCTTNTDMRGTDSAFLAASAPANFGDLAITATTGLVSVGSNSDKSGYTISGTITTLDALDTAQDSQHSATQADIAAVGSNVDAILVDTGTDIPARFDAIEGATFDTLTDSLEAIRNRGDTSWLTATGFSTHTASDVRTEMDSNSTQLAAIVADTNELQGDWVDGGRLDNILDARASQASVDALPTAVQIANEVLNAGQHYEQNQAASFFFVMVDNTDHVTRETGLTVTAERSLGAADTFGSATGTVTEVGNGVYRMAASAADMNATDIVFRFTASGADPVEYSIKTYVDAS